jgi:NitT/TauT family transport system substrate-binding protein
MNPTLRSRRQWLVAGAACVAAPMVRAQTPTKVAYGYSAVTDFASVFVAIDEGFFARRGLEVEAKFIPLNPTIVPALQSGSLQIGGPTPTVYLQALEGGLDHVVLGGGGVLSKTYTEVGLVAKAGAGIRSAADCVGKKIGVPGLGALLHVTFRQWLVINKVDPKQVNFIEAPFPQHADLIRGGSLDAVVSGGPFMSRIVESGSGYVAAYYMTFLPEGYPTILHVARRDWVEQNPAAVTAFREGIREAAAFMKLPANDARVRESCGKYMKLPPAVAAKMQISPTGPVVTVPQLQWWAGLMKEQALLKETPAFDKLIPKG